MISIKNAPRYLLLICILGNFLFLSPILILFFNDKGVSAGDFFLIQGLFYFAIVALEIPSGYIADLFSRKSVSLFGLLSAGIGYSFWIVGDGFWWLLFGQMFLAVSAAVLSGTTEAYLYDLLKRDNRQNEFHKLMANFHAFSNAGLLISALSGGFIYYFMGGNVPLYFTVASMVVAMIVLAFMPDVPEAKRQQQQGISKLQDILNISKKALSNNEIKWLILFAGFFSALSMILMWGLQSVMIAKEIPVYLFSVIYGINGFVRMILSFGAGKLFEKIKLSGVLFVLMVVTGIGCLGASLSDYAFGHLVYVCLFLMMLGSGSIVLAKVVTSTLVNHRIASDERATVLSVKSMVSRVMIGLGMVLLKPLFDSVGIGETFMISSVILVPIFFCALKLHRQKITF